MRDLNKLPLLTPELLLGSDPLPPGPPPGPVRLVLGDKAENPTVLRECFKKLGFLYEVDRVKEIPFEMDLSLNALPGMLMALGKLHGTRNSRNRASGADGDDYVLIVNLEGPHLVEQRDKEIVLGDGDAVFVSSQDPSAFTHKPPGNMLALRFPKAQFKALVKDADDRIMRMVPRDTPALNVLKSYCRLAWDERFVATPELKHLMVSHIYDLIALVASGAGDANEVAFANGVRAAKLQAIKEDVARSLDRPDLSVITVAERHACTPRFVQRLFEAEGTTFTEYVLSQRLVRAHRRLSDPRYCAEKISATAYECGFGDVSYFNRVFRRHYGVAPSDARAKGLQLRASA
jgi:AraC-like DNA-binding protein